MKRPTEGQLRRERKRMAGINQEYFLKDSQDGMAPAPHTGKVGTGTFKYKNS